MQRHKISIKNIILRVDYNMHNKPTRTPRPIMVRPLLRSGLLPVVALLAVYECR